MKQSVRVFLGVVVCLIMSLSGLMVGGLAGRAVLAAAPSGTGWVERRPAGDVNRVWYGLACDSTGTHLIAAASDNYAGGGWIYTSVDGGATWTIRHPVANSQYWPVSYTHLRAHETRHDLVCRLLLEKKKTSR